MFLDDFDDRYRDRFHRRSTFKQMFEYLDQFKNPIIIETGTTREIGNNAGDGNATLMFEEYVKEKGGHVYTIDIDPEACKIVSDHTDPKYTTVLCGDSLAVLPTLEVMPHLVYLDSYDLDVPLAIESGQDVASSMHHLYELQILLPKINDETLVVVDDSPEMWNYGKGSEVRKYYQSKNIEPFFESYHIGWINKKPSPTQGQLYESDGMTYLKHVYNTTHKNERCVEVPLALDFIAEHPNYVEVGAVLPYYGYTTDQVIDPFDELGNDKRRLKDCDLTGLNVVSISTLEHIGNSDYGNTDIDPHEALQGLEQIISQAKNYFITIPIGYNKVLDEDIEWILEDLNCYGLVRRNNLLELPKWEKVDPVTHLAYHYGYPFNAANFVLIITNKTI